jgi:hypothetical protein
MPSLFFICPNTRQQADTGIMTDAGKPPRHLVHDAQRELPALRRNARGLGARDLHRRCDPECVGDCAAGVRTSRATGGRNAAVATAIAICFRVIRKRPSVRIPPSPPIYHPKALNTLLYVPNKPTLP